nr:large proline-rich protein BAG6 isoform X1 [Ipomoea batatas]
MAERRGAYRRAVPLPLSLEKDMTPRAGEGEPTVANYCYVGGGRRGREWEPLDSTVVDHIINRLNDMIVPNQVILEIPYIPAYNWKSAKLLLGEHIQGSAQPQLEVVPGMLAKMDLPSAIFRLRPKKQRVGLSDPCESPGLLQISVVTGDGAAKSRICSTILAREEITAKVLEKIPVPSLKEQIGVFTGVSSYQQLDFRGRDSRDDKLLSDYHGGSSSGQHQGNNRSGISNLFEQKTLDFQRNKFICALLQLGSLTLESFSSSSVWSYYPC